MWVHSPPMAQVCSREGREVGDGGIHSKDLGRGISHGVGNKELVGRENVRIPRAWEVSGATKQPEGSEGGKGL